MTSTYADVYFKTSIKDGTGNHAEPPEDVYAQLIELVESGILKGDDGLTPYVGSNNNWWIGDIDTGVLARGTDGEDGYTPVKGVDYFTEEEIQQIQNEVSGGAIGDFKAVVDEETATFNANAENTLTGYNANAQEKFETYNANANSKFSDYNTNAEMKLESYNSNHTEKLTEYNTNAETKFSKYTSNAEAKLSEYNKNDLDKTALYNTNADNKFTTYNENAKTKFSEYNSNATTKLSEYNQNDSDKTALYNANAESKLDAYDSNAQAKLDLYNQNDSEKTEAYNSNTQAKLNAYNENAEQHTTDYNSNAEQKLESYNSNHTEKVAEYNANAESKTAEFDSNAAALQTEVDRLRGECDNLAAENRKQENRISALMKLNKGQTYDILPEEGETASRTAPSGAKYVSVDKVGGKSIVWNQLCNPDTFEPVDCTASESSGIVTISDCSEVNRYKAGFVAVKKGHKYYQTVKIKSDGVNHVGFQNYLFLNINTKTTSAEFIRLSKVAEAEESGNALIQIWSVNSTNYQIAKNSFMLFDLTLIFGAGNEPTAEQFEAMFPAESYPYNPGEIVSSRTETITAGAETITTGFPELRSAGTAHDEIDMDGGTIHRNIGLVDLGTLDWEYNSDYDFMISRVSGKKSGQWNLLCQRYNLDPGGVWMQGSDGVYCGNSQNNIVYIKDSKFTEPHAFKETMKGVHLNFELEAQTTEPVTIPEALQEWLPVEPGGTVAFRNSDESKQLAVPNAVSWVRKLDEVE